MSIGPERIGSCRHQLHPSSSSRHNCFRLIHYKKKQLKFSHNISIVATPTHGKESSGIREMECSKIWESQHRKSVLRCSSIKLLTLQLVTPSLQWKLTELLRPASSSSCSRAVNSCSCQLSGPIRRPAGSRWRRADSVSATSWRRP